ncbi:MAG: nickel ABC transporter permease [Candidatus Binatia bacterium]
MGSYVRQRLLVLTPTVLGVATLVFILMHMMPGDPVEVMLGETASPADSAALRARLGLDRPLATQYAAFIGGLLRLDLGTSIHSDQPVAVLVASHFPATALLTAAALAVALLVAFPAGLLAASHPRRMADRVTLTASLAGVAIPNFWLGPMLIMVFAIQLRWLPVSGTGGAANLVLPAITLGLGMAGILTRLIRSTVIETLHEDYVRTARAKGASPARVLWLHALRNALMPVLSMIGLQLGGLLAGSVITETIFAWPGIGRLTVQAIQTRDYPVVQGCVLTIAVGYVLVNLATDLAYAWANPRMRRAG